MKPVMAWVMGSSLILAKKGNVQPREKAISRIGRNKPVETKMDIRESSYSWRRNLT